MYVEKKNITLVKARTNKIGKTWTYKLIKLKLISFDIRTERVSADGPTIKGIDNGKTAIFLRFLSSKISSEVLVFLLILFSKTISYDMNNRNIPPIIWNEFKEIPIKDRKIFPKNKKNVSTEDEIKKTIIERWKVFFELMFDVKTTNKGINDIGSIAMNVLRRFWKKISCITVTK